MYIYIYIYMSARAFSTLLCFTFSLFLNIEKQTYNSLFTISVSFSSQIQIFQLLVIYPVKFIVA